METDSAEAEHPWGKDQEVREAASTSYEVA